MKSIAVILAFIAASMAVNVSCLVSPSVFWQLEVLQLTDLGYLL